jgi:hypothetical protein
LQSLEPAFEFGDNRVLFQFGSKKEREGLGQRLTVDARLAEVLRALLAEVALPPKGIKTDRRRTEPRRETVFVVE